MGTERLVQKAKRGNKQAFLQLMEIEQEQLYRTAFLYVKNKEDALDIVQETVYKAYTSIVMLKEPKYFKTWLMRIVIHAAIDFLNKRKRMVPLDVDIMSNVPTKEILSEDKIDLYKAIDTLGERHKTAIILRYYHDMTVSEIADVLQIPEGTVKSTIHRALHLLRLEIKEECSNE